MNSLLRRLVVIFAFDIVLDMAAERTREDREKLERARNLIWEYGEWWRERAIQLQTDLDRSKALLAEMERRLTRAQIKSCRV